MFQDAWGKHRSSTKDQERRYRTRIKDISDEIESLLVRVPRTKHEETAMAYENRIAELRSEARLLEEKISNQQASEGNFDKMFELSMSFLSNPYDIWKKGTYETKKTVQRLVFSAPLVTCRKEGLRTGETTIPFKALRFFSTSESKVVLLEGIETQYVDVSKNLR